MTIGIGFCYEPCSTCSAIYGYLSRKRLQVLVPPRVRFHQQHDIGIGSVRPPQQLIYSAITDVDIADSTRKPLPTEQQLCCAVFTGAPVVNGNSFATLNAKPTSAANTNTRTESSDR